MTDSQRTPGERREDVPSAAERERREKASSLGEHSPGATAEVRLTHERPYPAFVIADADAMGRSRLLAHFPVGWFFLQTGCGEEALRYYREFRKLVAGVILSEGIGWTGLDDERPNLEQAVRLFLEAEPMARVVVLVELADASAAAHWSERGAAACLPHPTRRVRRDEMLRRELDRLAVRFWEAEPGKA